jgi:O-antigen/teichoic acid export membrane protein
MRENRSSPWKPFPRSASLTREADEHGNAMTSDNAAPGEPNVGRGLPRAATWLRNVGFGYLDNVLGALIFIVLTPLFVVNLGLEAYAAWVLGQTIAFYLQLSDLGTSETQIRFHARYASQDRNRAIDELTGTACCVLLGAALVAGLLGLGIAFGPHWPWLDVSPAVAGDLRIVILVLTLQVVVAIPTSVFDNIYEALERFDVQNARSIVLRIVTAGAQFLLIRRGHGVVALVLVELVVTCIRPALDILILRRLAPGLLSVPLQFHRRIWRRIRRFLLWSSADDLIAEAGSYVDEIVLVILLPLALLTPYSLAGAIAAAMMLAVQPITATFFPLAASLHARRQTHDLARLLLDGTRMVTAIAAPIAIFIACFGHGVLSAWVAEGSVGTSDALFVILSVSGLISVYVWPASVILASIGRVRTVVALLAAELLLDIALMAALAPSFGLIGIALASLASNAALGLFVEFPLAARAIGVTPAAFLRETFGRLAPAILAGAAVAIGLKFIGMEPGWVMLGLAAMAIASVYSAVAWSTAARADREGMVALWRALRDGEWMRPPAAGVDAR